MEYLGSPCGRQDFEVINKVIGGHPVGVRGIRVFNGGIIGVLVIDGVVGVTLHSGFPRHRLVSFYNHELS